MSHLPSVAIVIPAYNEELAIDHCLDACINQTSPADEIIVVDNMSTDRTAEIVARYQQEYPKANIRLLYETDEQGITPARNHGFNHAKSEVIGRIDADSIIEPGWVEAVRKTFMRRDVAASTGPVLYHDMPMQKFGFAADEKIRRTLHRLARDHRFLFGSNMAIRASAWQQIAALTSHDPDDQMHEDIDLALVLYKNDLEIVYDPTMMAGMSARRLEDSPRDFYNYVMRFERTFKAHGIKSATARIPIFIYLLIYFPVRTVRKFYDGETNQFTLKKLRDELVRDKQTINSDK
jgi:glycosyltransferase involved in cell wall biosynthesis